MASSALVIIFVLYFFIHLLNALGAEAINDLLWRLYNKFPTSTSGSANEQMRLRSEVLRLKRELGAVSAQDDFARWAKLRRQHDKVMAEHDKCSSSMNDSKAAFDRTVKSLRWLGTNGLRLFFQIWYSREALFWIPQGWVPGYVEWVLAFPRAPRGSVSVQIWGIACASIIQMVSEAIMAVYVLASEKPEKNDAGRQAFAAGGEGPSKSEKARTRREL